MSERMRNLTVDDVLWHVDGSEVDFPGSADVNSADDESYETIANGRDIEEHDDQGC